MTKQLDHTGGRIWRNVPKGVTAYIDAVKCDGSVTGQAVVNDMNNLKDKTALPRLGLIREFTTPVEANFTFFLGYLLLCIMVNL